MIELFLLLAAGHYLADFPLQGDAIARNKGKVFVESVGFHALTAHAAIHALVAAGVAMVLGYDWLWAFLVVGATHWLIDFGKSWERWPDSWRITDGARWPGNPDARGLYGINVDQALHMAVPVGLAALLTGGLT
ncbi:hypothetical protein LCGC14_2132150 [marine sediment metagenome]|uniref:DUF3307 domain-containing protein n=1 Tax=marine sediment metagenome TaxID=412755 RepID=A0A0F9E140_9ZZZZ